MIAPLAGGLAPQLAPAPLPGIEPPILRNLIQKLNSGPKDSRFTPRHLLPAPYPLGLPPGPTGLLPPCTSKSDQIIYFWRYRPNSGSRGGCQAGAAPPSASSIWLLRPRNPAELAAFGKRVCPEKIGVWKKKCRKSGRKIVYWKPCCEKRGFSRYSHPFLS